MKVIKKFLLFELDDDRLNDERIAKLSLGKDKGGYYAEYPQEEFDTEEDAINEAYERNKYGTYIIVTQIKFDYF